MCENGFKNIENESDVGMDDFEWVIMLSLSLIPLLFHELIVLIKFIKNKINNK